jgi:hypothetical protein
MNKASLITQLDSIIFRLQFNLEALESNVSPVPGQIGTVLKAGISIRGDIEHLQKIKDNLLSEMA